MVKNKILDNIVKKYDSDKFSTSIGTVTRYYPQSNSVDVSVETKGTKNLCLECIPLPVFSNGMHSLPPNVGDTVLVSFTNNSALQGKVISLIDCNYEFKTRNAYSHIESGAYNCNVDFDKIKFEKTKKPLCDYWIDKENENPFKYLKYAKNNPLESLISDLSNIGRFDKNDLGFIHPTNKSIVKIKNDGTIEIFTADNNGISVNPISKSITLISNDIVNKCDTWRIESEKVNIVCNDFNVKSKKITLDGEELDIQNNGKSFEIKDIIKEI